MTTIKNFKMKKKISVLFIFLAVFGFSQQVYENYPPGQTDYVGGNVQFYKDFKKVLIEKNIKPCEKNEHYLFRLVIYPDQTIKYIKEEDQKYLEENKCAFDVSREVAKYLDGWNPASVDGKNVAAMTSFWIFPDELFGELPEGYNPVNDMILANYEGGINNFRKKVVQDIDMRRFTFNGKFRIEVTFVIEKDGKMSNVQLAQSSGLKEFDDMLVNRIKGIRNKWTPASIHGVPIKYRFRLPLLFSAE